MMSAGLSSGTEGGKSFSQDENIRTAAKQVIWKRKTAVGKALTLETRKSLRERRALGLILWAGGELSMLLASRPPARSQGIKGENLGEKRIRFVRRELENHELARGGRWGADEALQRGKGS